MGSEISSPPLNKQNLNGSSPILSLKAISSETVDGSLLYSQTEAALHGESLVLLSSNPFGLIETLDTELMDHSPSNPDGSCSIKTLGRSETLGNADFVPRSSTLNQNGSLSPSHIRDYESVGSSNATECSPSSQMEYLYNQCLALVPFGTRPGEALQDEDRGDGCDDQKSPMQLESINDPSSSSRLRLVDEEHNGEDDDELNFERRRQFTGYPSYCNCDEHLRFRPYACQRRGTCDPYCRRLQSHSQGDPWHPSKKNREDKERWMSNSWHGENREYMPLATSFPVQDTGVGAGLSNLGNTCFINAILQCFTHTVPLVKALRCSNHSARCQGGIQGFCVVCTLREHIELSLVSSGKIISPTKVVDNLNHISSCFHRYQQEDAHEFLQCFLDKIERCLNSNLNDETASSQDDNIVERVFGGRLVSKLCCCNCGHCSDKYEPLIDLSLEIEDVETLQCALESFTKVEKIEDPDTKFICDNCKEEVSREKQLMLDKTPSIAALHLKRFKTDGFSIEKIGKHLEFPLDLDLKPYTNVSQDNNENQGDLKYQLYAVVVHNGFLPTSGHYFCYIRSSLSTWHKLDDSMVVKVDEDLVLSQTAYILFYAREGTLWCSRLIESQKDCLDSSISNTSPKSVLDSIETECVVYPQLVNIDYCKAGVTRVDVEGISTDFSSTVVEAQISETWNDAGRISAQVSCDSRQTRPKLCCDESTNDIPTNAVSVSLVPMDCNAGILYNEKLGALPSDEENYCARGANKIERNDGLHPLTPPRSSTPVIDFGGLSEVRHRRDHLKPKVENSLNCKKPKKGTRDQRMEAVRYISKNVPSARGIKLLAALRPQYDEKKRSRSSPCKQASPPGSRYKHTRCMAVLR